MPVPRIDSEAFEQLGQWLEPPPPPPPIAEENEAWEPNLTPAQQKLWESVTKNILTWSEKFSGKTVGCLHKLVRHLYDNQNALAVILVRVKSMANKGGAWEKLTNFVLPVWREGNRDRKGNFLDRGMGLQFSEVKFDAQHNEMVYVQNRHGGWSRVVFVSAPHANQLRDRIRGYEPSFVFLDELTSCDSSIYFTAVAAQIGRVMGIPLQQFVAACNPEGESHWVYQTWFIKAFNEALGDWDPDYEQIYFPREENRKNVGDEYFSSLDSIYKDDPIEAARMIEGLWKERVAGDGLFSDLFNVAVHVRPSREDGTPDHSSRLMPHPDHAIILGLDPGAVYNVFEMMQWLPVEGRMKWMIFDEVVIFKRKVSYPLLIPVVMRRLKFWRELAGKEIPFVCISDDSAVNVFRPGQGTYDALDMQRSWELNRVRYGLESLKIRPCPRFGESRKARIRILQTALGQEEVLVSSACGYFKAMCEQLRSEPQKEGAAFDPEKAMTPMRCDHLHVFDAATYPMLAGSTQPSLLIPVRANSQSLFSAAA